MRALHRELGAFWLVARTAAAGAWCLVKMSLKSLERGARAGPLEGMALMLHASSAFALTKKALMACALTGTIAWVLLRASFFGIARSDGGFDGACFDRLGRDVIGHAVSRSNAL